ncbi:MAG: nuclear transport factor 2 family protein [Chloroflexi bacterium]|nr:nuclear transport factor 2 family protein [Chloroflexota bacterium]
MADPSQVVRDFCDAWATLKADKVCSYFTDDAVWINMPNEDRPTIGRQALETSIGRLFGMLAGCEFAVKHLTAGGSIVLTERVDTMRWPDRSASIPVMGIFELRGDKIAAWRDYYDAATWQKRSAPPQQ